MQKAYYRKINDRTQNSSTYHKKDGTAVRAKLKQNLQKTLNKVDTIDNLTTGEPCDHPGCCSHISHPCEGCGRIGCE